MRDIFNGFQSKHDSGSDEPLLEDNLSSEEVTTLSKSRTRYFPSLQQAFNVVAILYIALSLPTLFSFLKNQRTQIYCQCIPAPTPSEIF